MPISSSRLREFRCLAGVIGVHVADADDVDVVGLQAQLGQLLGDRIVSRDERTHVLLASSERSGSRVPEQYLVAVADQIAAIGDLARAFAYSPGLSEKKASKSLIVAVPQSSASE